MATTTELIDQTRYLTRTSGDNRDLPVGAILSLLNEAQNRLAEEANLVVNTTTTWACTASTQEYTLPTNILTLEKVLYYTDTVLTEIDYQHIDESDEPSTVESYYRRMVSGVMKMGFWGIPGTTGDTITLWYNRLPLPLTQAASTGYSTTPEFPSQYHQALYRYVVWQHFNAYHPEKAREAERLWEREVNRVIHQSSKLSRAHASVVYPYDIRMDA